MTLDFEIQEAVAFRTGAAAALADLQDQLAKRDPARADAAKAGVDELGAIVDEASEKKEGVRPADDVEALTDRVEDDLARDDAEGVAGAERRVRLRPDRADARPPGGRRRRAAVPAGRAGAARGLRVLRVRAGAAAQVVRSRARHRRRGADLVRRRRHARPGRADRRPRAAARDPRDPARARREARRRRRDARRLREQGDGRDQLGDHRLPRGPRGGPHPRRDHRVVRRRPPPDAPPGADRRGPRPRRHRHHLGARADAAEVARAVRREARGGGRPRSRSRCCC